MNKDELINLILKERARQLDLPGSEFDVTKTPNDWIAIASHYLNRSITRNNLKPISEEFEENLIQAAAVILAALEHIDKMKESGDMK